MTMTPHTEHDVTLDEHRASCAECRALWAELEAISDRAAELPDLAPSRDLWAGIEARLGPIDAMATGATEAAAESSAQQRAKRRWFSAPIVRLAVAASLLVAVSSAVTWQIASRDADNTDLAAAIQEDDATGAVHLASFTASVTQLDQEIAVLQAIVSERRESLDPRTIAVLEANLTVIDAAIADSRAALKADPASQFLAAEFARAYTSKLTLLREAALLPTGL
ncbi:MAG: hypothetical protein KF709_04845 [Gemmatimonadaceae bacterium]|nr:hypothetical protein [Gemmatimonadaceae bacterium]